MQKQTCTKIEVDLEQVAQVNNLHDATFLLTFKFDTDNDTELAKHIIGNGNRYVSLFEDVIDELLPESDIRVRILCRVLSYLKQPDDSCNPLDLIIFQRKQRDAMREEGDRSHFPKILTRRLYVFLQYLYTAPSFSSLQNQWKRFPFVKSEETLSGTW